MPGALTFLDLLVTGDEDRFVERDIRIARLAASEATEARAAIRATIPPPRSSHLGSIRRKRACPSLPPGGRRSQRTQ